MITEKIELLGKGIYADIPGELTLKAFPTVTELDYVSSEDFEKTMLETIFPQCIEENINFHKLLEIDFQWICRCLRILNYGPYFTPGSIFCNNCGRVDLECQVDLRAVGCNPLPEGFTNDVVVKKDELLDYKHDIHFHLLTIQESLDLRKDKLFFASNGEFMRDMARVCYSMTSFGTTKDVTPVTAKIEIEKNMSNPDFKILKSVVSDLTDFGLRGGGRCHCPKCNEKGAFFMALPDDRFFRPTVGDLRKGRNDRNLRGIQIPARDTEETV